MIADMQDPHIPQLIQAVNQLHASLVQLDKNQTRIRRRLYELEARQRLADAGRKPAMPVRFLSQYGEDMLLWDLFDGVLDGFFVEVGAFDGLEFSVSYAFESVGWRGLLIEPLPDRYRQCVENRPGCRTVNAALSRAGSTGTTMFSACRGADMLSYLTTTEDHVRRTHNEGSGADTIHVPLAAMDDLLVDHSGPVDFAVIDVEGGEMDLLAGFDLERFKPRALLVEDSHFNQGSAVTSHLTGRGYQLCARLDVNSLFVLASETTLLARARHIA